MTTQFSFTTACRALVIFMFCVFTAVTAAAQSPESRITQPVVEFQRVVLPGDVHPMVNATYDQGALEDSAPANRMLLLLSRTDAQQKALEKLLKEQQTPGSANYHQWLTPEQFRAQFGASEPDVQKVVGCATGCGNVSSKSNHSQPYTFAVTSPATAYGATTTQTNTFTVTN